MKKLGKLLIIMSFVVIISINHTNINHNTIYKNNSTQQIQVKYENAIESAGTQLLCWMDSMAIYSWAKEGSSVSWSFSTDPSKDIEVWVMDKAQYNDFCTTGNPSGILLMTSENAAGYFFPPYDDRWYIVFFNSLPPQSCIYLTYDVDFPPYVLVTKPSASTTVLTESNLKVTWDSNIIGGGVKIELYKRTSLYIVLDSYTSNDGIEYYYIPENYDSGQEYRIKISLISSGANDFSDYFSILKRAIYVFEPYSNRVLIPHTSFRIEWSSRGVSSKVKIDLYLNSTYILEIINETENDDMFMWTVWQGEYYANTTLFGYHVKIQDCANPKYYGFSPYFTITNEKYMKILSPQANSSYKTGNVLPIQWETDTPCSKVQIELKIGNETKKLITITENTGMFNWTIPSNLKSGKNYYIFIKAIDNSTYAFSGEFKIINNVKIPSYNMLFLLLVITLSALYLVKNMIRNSKQRIKNS